MDLEDKDQSNSRQTNQHVLPINRRNFLKFSGIALLSTFADVQISSLRSPTNHSMAIQIDQDKIEEALEIASKSSMYQEAVLELENLNYHFVADLPFVTYTFEYEDLFGIILKHKSSTNPRTGADLVMTFNLVKQSLDSLEYTIGWCLLNSLEVSSVFFDAGKPLYEELRPERIYYEDPPRMIRPRSEQFQSFSRPDSPKVRPEDLVLEGWPIETPKSDYWHYDGCTLADWMTEGDSMFLCCRANYRTQVEGRIGLPGDRSALKPQRGYHANWIHPIESAPGYREYRGQKCVKFRQHSVASTV